MRRVLPMLALVAAATAALAGPMARVTLQNDKTTDLELLGRRGDGLITRAPGNPAEITHAFKDLKRVEFVITYDKADPPTLYQKGQFAEAAAALEPVVTPWRPFLDLPNNNGTQLYLLYAKSLFWAKQYEKSLAACDGMKTALEPYDRLAQALRVLDLLELRRLEDAGKQADAIQPLTPADPEGALYFYAIARLRLAQERIPEAQEAAARIVAFFSRNMEWMPAGLLASAQGYEAAGKYSVASTIADEVRQLFAESPWAERAEELFKHLEPLVRQEAAELEKQKQAERAEVAIRRDSEGD